MFKVGDKVRFNVEAYEHDIDASASQAYKRCVGAIGTVTHVVGLFKTKYPIEVDFGAESGVLFRECELELAKPEPEFKYVTYRCEWQVVISQVDEYGRDLPDSATVLAKWPTAAQAYADLRNHGTPHQYVTGRWVPNNPISAYEYLEVRYKEIKQ